MKITRWFWRRTRHLARVAPLLSVACLLSMPSVVEPAFAQEREGGRSAEGQAGPRRSAEGEQGPRRSAEGEQGPRRSAEGEQGPRRSAEGEQGPRRSAEGEQGPRRSAEGEQGPRRSAEGEQGPRRSAEGEQGPRRSAEGDRPVGRNQAEGERAQVMEALRGFQPQNQREAALLQMIVQLQREVASLRQEVRARGGSEGQRMEAEPRRDGRVREGDAPRDGKQASATRFRDFELPPNWQRTKEGQVFLAYDKNRDNIVSLDEWLAMTNGNINAQRRQISTGHFNDAEPSGDGKFTPAEFIWWRQVGSRQAAEGQQRGARDGEGQQRGPRDGEGQQRGPRDGEGQQRGARDGEGQQRGARDGDPR